MKKRIAEVKNEITKNMYSVSVDFARDCGGDYGLISDRIIEYADGMTSIYYSDIIKFIAENVEAVNDAILEFGWDGCGEDLYKAGQMAEYKQHVDRINEDLENVVQYIMVEDAAIRTDDGLIDAEIWEQIKERAGEITADNNIEDIHELIRDIFAEQQEKREQIIDAVEKAAASVVETISGTSAPAPAVI